MRKKVFIYLVAIYSIILVQSTLLDFIRIYDVKPNIPIVFIVAIALLRGNVEGAVIGFFIGLVQDMLSGKSIGLYAIMGMYTGFISGSLNKRLYRENLFVCIFFTFIATILYEFIVFIPTIVLEGFYSVLYVFKKIIFIEAIYNSISSIVIYILAVKMNYKLEDINKAARKY